MVKIMIFLLLLFSFLPMQSVAAEEHQTDPSTVELEEAESTDGAETDKEEANELEEGSELEVESEEEEANETNGEPKKEELIDTEQNEDVNETEKSEAPSSHTKVKLMEAENSEEAEEEATNEFDVTIMHMNDTHAHVEAMPKILSAIKNVRAEKENTLLLHGGDVFSGTLYFNEYKGQADVALMNLMGFDAMVFGNHEFDLGSNENGHKSLSEFVQEAKFPLLGSNIDFSNDPFMAGFVNSNPLVENATGGQAYHSIVKEIDGEKVGIFGLTTEDTVDIASPMSVTFNNYLNTAKEAVKMFEDAGINKVIAVTHIGYDSNPAVGNDLLLAQVEGIDVIVGGHSHTKLSEPKVITTDAKGNEKNPTIVVQAGQYAENLGKLDVTFNEDGVITEHNGELIKGEDFEEDPEAVEVLRPFKEKIDNVMNEPSGAEALKDLQNPRLTDGNNDSVRANETELGNLVTDAMLAKAKEKFPETVIALQNGGGIRAPIDKGPIAVGEIIAVLPFGNDPVVATVTGAELKEILEHSVNQAPNESGGFLHVSGMTFTYDSNEEPGSRVIKMEVKDRENYVEIEQENEYLITTNQFTAEGGDGFETFAKIYADGRVTNIGEVDWEQLRNYMVEEKYLNGIVDPVREGRITNIAFEEPVDPDPNPGEEPTDPPGDPQQPGEDPNGDPGEDPNVDTGEDPNGNTDKDPKDPEKPGKGATDDGNGQKGMDEDKSGKKLPSTATTIYTTILIGTLLVVLGAAVYLIRRRITN